MTSAEFVEWVALEKVRQDREPALHKDAVAMSPEERKAAMGQLLAAEASAKLDAKERERGRRR